MPRYLVQATYTPEAVATFASQPQDRTEGLRTVIQRLGGQLETLDFSLGDDDVIFIYSAPDETTAVAVSLAVQAPGHVRVYKTTRLISAEEFIAAQRKAQGAGYQGPSRG